MAARVVVYTTGYCPYCTFAKRLLEKKAAAYEEIRVDDRTDLRAWLVERTHQRTVPQVFVNGVSVGGFDQLSALDRAGKLESMLAADPSPSDPAVRA